jgi:hypothetical protein
MYSGTVKPRDLFIAELERKVGPIKRSELQVGPDAITCLPCERPWLTGLGMGLIYITDVRRREDGKLEFQLADQVKKPYEAGTVWRTADRFPDEWPD